MHVTKLMKYEVLNNGQINIVIRCDADPSTDFSGTMSPQVAADEVQRTAYLTECATECANNHQAAMAAQAGVLPLVGTEIPQAK